MTKKSVKSFSNIYTRLKLKEYKIDATSVRMVCLDKHLNVKRNFVLVGRKAVKKFPETFRIGDHVNIVAEGVLIKRMSKGIDMEV